MALANYKAPIYTPNFGALSHYFARYREHQTAALAAANQHKIGQILLPCGTGKTMIQVGIHAEDMILKTSQNQRGNYVIASHRLALNMQLLNKVVDLAVKCGLPFDILFVGSDRPDLKQYYDYYSNFGYTSKISTHRIFLSKSDIEKFIKESISNNRHTIIVSTYDSIALLSNIGKIAVCTHDEAHNTTEQFFTDNILAVKPNIQREYFFTATRRVKGDDGGMNDTNFYGNVIYDAFPSLMLSKGEIVCPRIHPIYADKETNQTNIANDDMIAKNIIEAFTNHQSLVNKYSVDSSKIGAKLLISFASIPELKTAYKHPLIVDFTKSNSIKTFAIASGLCYYNGDSCNRKDFMKLLNKLSDTENAIISNVDILTEGIDLPSITGVMPMRNMSLSKLIQLFGRALRLHETDRDKLYNNTITPCDYIKYIKPYGWLVIPRHLANLSKKDEMTNAIKEVMRQYETPAEELVLINSYVNKNNDDPARVIEPDSGVHRLFNLVHGEEGVVSSLIMEQLTNLIKNAQENKQLFEEMLI